MWLSVWCRMLLSKKACLDSLDWHSRLIVISLLMASATPFLHVSSRHSLLCLCLKFLITNTDSSWPNSIIFLSLKRWAPPVPAETKSSSWRLSHSLPLESFSVTSWSLCSWWRLRSNTSCQNSAIMLRCCPFCPAPSGWSGDSSSHTTSGWRMLTGWGNEQMAETKCRMQ